MADELAEGRGLIPSEFYRRILAVMPIVCVDLMVIDIVLIALPYLGLRHRPQAVAA
jgi:hypothetical protein